MRCPYCGSEVHKAERHCDHCGRKPEIHVEPVGWFKH
jgi:predicted amidophosphoribosyltransferase